MVAQPYVESPSLLFSPILLLFSSNPFLFRSSDIQNEMNDTLDVELLLHIHPSSSSEPYPINLDWWKEFYKETLNSLRQEDFKQYETGESSMLIKIRK